MLRSRPQLKGALFTLLAIALLLIGIWVWIGVRTGIWTLPEYGRNLWLVPTIPITMDLWRGNIRAGDSADELISEWRPDDVFRFGQWVEMQWYPGGRSDDIISFVGVSVIAKNGVLVYANSYSDDGLNNRVFFNTESTNDQAEFEKAQEANIDDLDLENALVNTELPVFDYFWQGNIKAGNKVEGLIKSRHPSAVTCFGHWTVVRWFPQSLPAGAVRLVGLRVIAKDGLLVYANSFTDDGHHSTFFDTETPHDKADYDAAYLAYDKSLQAANESSLNSPATNQTSSLAGPIK
jgi:hypothetical protein